MITISVKDNLAEIIRTLSAIEREAIPRALPTAINRTGRHAESVGVKVVAKVMGASQRSVRKRIHRQLARRNNPVLIISCFGSKLNIASFSGTRAGAKGRVLASFIFTQGGRRKTVTQRAGGGVRSRAFGKSRVYPGTFLINNGKTAMKRVGKSRLPIRPVYGPGIAREFERNRGMIEAAARAVFPKQMDDALRAALQGYVK